MKNSSLFSSLHLHQFQIQTQTCLLFKIDFKSRNLSNSHRALKLFAPTLSPLHPNQTNGSPIPWPTSSQKIQTHAATESAAPPSRRRRFDLFIASSGEEEKGDKGPTHSPDSTPANLVVSTYSLPAKKRVWALPPELVPEKPISTLDLNLEYKPDLGEESEAVVDNSEECTHAVCENAPEKSEGDTGGEEENDDEDGIVCAVCKSTDGDPSDPIVFCDGCDVMVHATCYGNPLVKGIPEGDWFCTQCSSSSVSSQSNESYSCCLCPGKGGAMKPTGDGRWAHIVCALYVPEVFFKDPEGREEIDCSKVPKRRWKERCYVCKSARGCAIQCSEIKCPLAFHVTCGLNEDLCIEYREGRKGDIVAGFCRTHTDLWEKQQESGKFKIVARKD